MRGEMFEHKIDKLRTPDRVAQLEVQRVVHQCVAHCGFHHLLDVGTGSGLFAEAFAARGVQVIGVDPDPDMIVAARFYVPGMKFFVGTAEELPFADQSFEALFMGMVLHETDDPLLALQEARRVSIQLLAVLEWPFPGPGDPPPPARRFRVDEIQSFSRAAGFSTCAAHRLKQLVLYLVK